MSMSAISVHNCNYDAKEFLSSITRILTRDNELLGRAVQRSVTAKSHTGKNDHVITAVEVLSRGASADPEVTDYGNVVLSREVLSLDCLLERVRRLEAREFRVGPDVFQFEINFGFSDRYEPSNNCYGEWPGQVFDAGANAPSIPSGPLWHPHLPSYDSVFDAIREFLNWKAFHCHSDARLGHTIIYVPNFNGRLHSLNLNDRQLTVSTSGALPPEMLILEVLYSLNGRKQRFKKILSSAVEKVVLEFVPSELKVLLFSADGNLLDVHDETPLYSSGCNAVLPKSKPALVSPLQASSFLPSIEFGSDYESFGEMAARPEVVPQTLTLNALPKKEHLLAEIEALLAESCQLALLVVDLDNFKQVNDTKGHLEGDVCLEAVISVIVEAVARKGTLYRWGGDEFAVLLPNFNEAEAEATAERIRVSVIAAKMGGDIRVTASIGVTATDQGVQVSAEDLLCAADTAMYASKNSGKNRVTSGPAEKRARIGTPS